MGVEEQKEPTVLASIGAIIFLSAFNIIACLMAYFLLQSMDILPEKSPQGLWVDSVSLASTVLYNPSATPIRISTKAGIVRGRQPATSTPFLPMSPSPLPVSTPQPTFNPRKPSEHPTASTVKGVGQELPKKAEVTGVKAQPQSLPLSCEARAAVDWAGFFGVSIDEVEFQKRLPVSDNPEVGFVGDVNGSWGQIPPNPYGVHAPPVASLLQQYGLKAKVWRNMTFKELQAEIAGGKPVIAWVKGNLESGSPQIYTAQDGKQVAVTPYEHTVLVIGYDLSENQAVTVTTRGNQQTYPLNSFLDSWNVLGNMAITSSG